MTGISRTRAIDLGYSGEDLLVDFFLKRGHNAVKSSNTHDKEKDLIVDSASVEVKTQVPYRVFGTKRKPAFTVPIMGYQKVRRNQLTKCVNVDRLIFIKRPESKDKVIRIYEANPPGSRHFEIVQNYKDGRLVAGFYIDDMNELGTITDPILISKFMEERTW